VSRTGDEVASLAARGLAKGKRGLTDEEFKSVCSSALNQHENVATYTQLKNRAAVMKRKLRKTANNSSDVDLDLVLGFLDVLVNMTKPLPSQNGDMP